MDKKSKRVKRAKGNIKGKSEIRKVKDYTFAKQGSWRSNKGIERYWKTLKGTKKCEGPKGQLRCTLPYLKMVLNLSRYETIIQVSGRSARACLLIHQCISSNIVLGRQVDLWISIKTATTAWCTYTHDAVASRLQAVITFIHCHWATKHHPSGRHFDGCEGYRMVGRPTIFMFGMSPSAVTTHPRSIPLDENHFVFGWIIHRCCSTCF